MKIQIKDANIVLENDNVSINEKLDKILKNQDLIMKTLYVLVSKEDDEEYVLLSVDLIEDDTFVEKEYTEPVLKTDIDLMYKDYRDGVNFQTLKKDYLYEPKNINAAIFNKRNTLIRDESLIIQIMHMYSKHKHTEKILSDLEIDKEVYDYIVSHNEHLINKTPIGEIIKGRGRQSKYDLDLYIEIFELYRKGGITMSELCERYKMSYSHIHNICRPDIKRTRKDFWKYVEPIVKTEEYKVAIRNNKSKNYKTRMPKLRAEQRIAIYLEYYESKCIMIDLANKYNLSLSTINRIVNPSKRDPKDYLDLLDKKGYKYHKRIVAK